MGLVFGVLSVALAPLETHVGEPTVKVIAGIIWFVVAGHLLFRASLAWPRWATRTRPAPAHDGATARTPMSMLQALVDLEGSLSLD